MTKAKSEMDLTGKLLIAMPGMGDPRFHHGVIFICEHSDRGAMGLIVNKPLADLPFARLLEQLEIEVGPGAKHARVHFGGPVESGRGFVLHSTDYGSSEGTMKVRQDYAMTATLDVLEDISAGRGPARAILALGYAGWGPGQLEDEIGQNGWLTAEASDEVIFTANNPSKWDLALKSLGIDAITLSATAGRA